MALVAAAALVQLALGFRLEVLGVAPNLVLVAVVAIAWTMGARAGMLAACGGGLLLDLGSPGALGPHALALLPGAYLIGLWPRANESPNVLLVGLSAAPATLLYTAVLVGFGSPQRLAGGAAVYNLVLASMALAGVKALGLGRISRRAQA